MEVRKIIDRVVAVVVKETGVDELEIRSNRRLQRAFVARGRVVWLLRGAGVRRAAICEDLAISPYGYRHALRTSRKRAEDAPAEKALLESLAKKAGVELVCPTCRQPRPITEDEHEEQAA